MRSDDGGWVLGALILVGGMALGAAVNEAALAHAGGRGEARADALARENFTLRQELLAKGAEADALRRELTAAGRPVGGGRIPPPGVPEH